MRLLHDVDDPRSLELHLEDCGACWRRARTCPHSVLAADEARGDPETGRPMLECGGCGGGCGDEVAEAEREAAPGVRALCAAPENVKCEWMMDGRE